MMGTAPTELMKVMASAQRDLGPRMSFAGLRARSTRAASLSTPSQAPAARISRWFRELRSFHFIWATATASAARPPVASLLSDGDAVDLTAVGADSTARSLRGSSS